MNDMMAARVQVHPLREKDVGTRGMWVVATALRCLAVALIPITLGGMVHLGITNGTFWVLEGLALGTLVVLFVVRSMQRRAWDHTAGADYTPAPGESVPDFTRAELVVPVWDLAMMVTVVVLVSLGGQDASTQAQWWGVQFATGWIGFAAGVGIPLHWRHMVTPQPGQIAKAVRTLTGLKAAFLFGAGGITSIQLGLLGFFLMGLILGVALWALWALVRNP